MTIYFFWPFIILAILGALKLTLDAINGEDVTLYNDFSESARLRGLTPQEAADEWRLREELARLRRRASDAVMLSPQDWAAALNTAKKEAIERLAEDRSDLVPVLANTLKALHYGDLLYPDAAKVVDRLPVYGGGMSADARAALRAAK